MNRNSISERARRLIAEHIRSVECLEILLLLFEARDRAWSVDDIESRIRSTKESVAKNVADLVAADLVTASAASATRYQYVAGHAELDDAVSQLASAYRTRRVTVIELIYADRNAPLRNFSEAFKLGRTNDR